MNRTIVRNKEQNLVLRLNTALSDSIVEFNGFIRDRSLDQISDDKTEELVKKLQDTLNRLLMYVDRSKRKGYVPSVKEEGVVE